MNTSVQWAAQLTHVREVSLLGTADLTCWQDRLKAEGLLPTARDGRAQVLVVAAAAKFLGVPFRELSFSVLVCRQENATRQDGAYLVRAFNSCRLFAWCERVFFSTPYDCGDVRVSAACPASIQLTRGGEVLLRAEMRADLTSPDRLPSRKGEDGWEGPVFLPTRPKPGGGGRWFYARLQGQTETYPFLPGEDTVTIRPAPGAEVLQALLDSHFVATGWAVRADAAHAKSRTYPGPNR